MTLVRILFGSAMSGARIRCEPMVIATGDDAGRG